MAHALIAVGAAAALALGTAGAASADTITISNLPDEQHPLDQAFTVCDDDTIGQSFTATATGAITSISIIRYGVGLDATLELHAGEGTSGTAAAAQAVTLPLASVEPFDIELETPFPVVSGEQYTFEFADAPTCMNQQHFYGLSGYGSGAVYVADTRYDDSDLAFQVTIETTLDADADGIVDSADQCPDTTFSSGPKLKPNHVWSTSAAGFVDRTGTVRYTLADTHGCSAEQIITAARLGAGMAKQGLPPGAMKDWIG